MRRHTYAFTNQVSLALGHVTSTSWHLYAAQHVIHQFANLNFTTSAALAHTSQGLLLAHRTLAYQLHMKRLSVMPSAASCLSAGSSNGAVARQTTMQQRVAVQLADEVRDHRAMMQALRTLGVTLPTLSSRVRKQLAQRVKRTMVMRLEQRTQRRLRLATAAGTLAHPQLGHAQGQRVPSHPS